MKKLNNVAYVFILLPEINIEYLNFNKSNHQCTVNNEIR